MIESVADYHVLYYRRANLVVSVSSVAVAPWSLGFPGLELNELSSSSQTVHRQLKGIAHNENLCPFNLWAVRSITGNSR